MMKQEKTFLVTALLIAMFYMLGVYTQSTYGVVKQDAVKIVETQVVVYKDVIKEIEVPKDCSKVQKLEESKGWFE